MKKAPIIPPEFLSTSNTSDALKGLEDEDIAFEELAAESLSKSTKPLESVKIEWNIDEQNIAFEAFETE